MMSHQREVFTHTQKCDSEFCSQNKQEQEFEETNS